LHTPHSPPFFAQYLQYLQFLHALQLLLPVQVASVIVLYTITDAADSAIAQSNITPFFILMVLSFDYGGDQFSF